MKKLSTFSAVKLALASLSFLSINSALASSANYPVQQCVHQTRQQVKNSCSPLDGIERPPNFDKRAQQYFIEACLAARTDVDGNLITHPVLRYETDPVYVFRGKINPDTRQFFESEIQNLVKKATGGKLKAIFVDEGKVKKEDYYQYFHVEFIGGAAVVNFPNRTLNFKRSLTGGRMALPKDYSSLSYSRKKDRDVLHTIRHEFIHSLGVDHDRGNAYGSLMSQRSHHADLTPSELKVIQFFYQLPSGTTLSDLIKIGVIDQENLIPEPTIKTVTRDEYEQSIDIIELAPGQNFFIHGSRFWIPYGSVSEIRSHQNQSESINYSRVPAKLVVKFQQGNRLFESNVYINYGNPDNMIEVQAPDHLKSGQVQIWLERDGLRSNQVIVNTK